MHFVMVYYTRTKQKWFKKINLFFITRTTRYTGSCMYSVPPEIPHIVHAARIPNSRPAQATGFFALKSQIHKSEILPPRPPCLPKFYSSLQRKQRDFPSEISNLKFLHLPAQIPVRATRRPPLILRRILTSFSTKSHHPNPAAIVMRVQERDSEEMLVLVPNYYNQNQQSGQDR